MFHAKDGWYFHRLPDGGVCLTRQEPVVRHDEFGFVHDAENPGRFVVLERVEFDASTWASIVASVSKAGENANSFHAAEAFHGS